MFLFSSVNLIHFKLDKFILFWKIIKNTRAAARSRTAARSALRPGPLRPEPGGCSGAATTTSFNWGAAAILSHASTNSSIYLGAHHHRGSHSASWYATSFFIIPNSFFWQPLDFDQSLTISIRTFSNSKKLANWKRKIFQYYTIDKLQNEVYNLICEGVVNGSASSGRKNRYIDTTGGRQWIGWVMCVASVWRYFRAESSVPSCHGDAWRRAQSKACVGNP